MCECLMIANGLFNSITIKENMLSFNYIDKNGVKHTLIKQFAMDIIVTKASVSEIKRDGVIVGYQFNLS